VVPYVLIKTLQVVKCHITIWLWNQGVQWFHPVVTSFLAIAYSTLQQMLLPQTNFSGNIIYSHLSNYVATFSCNKTMCAVLYLNAMNQFCGINSICNETMCVVLYPTATKQLGGINSTCNEKKCVVLYSTATKRFRGINSYCHET